MFQADVCINTTSSSLTLSDGMVSKSILAKGGQTLQEQCNKHIKDHGKVPAWGFATTTGGDTPFKYIIHTVGAAYKQWNAPKVQKYSITLHFSFRRASEILV